MFVRNPFLFLLIALSLFFQLPQVAQANSESRDEPDVFVPNEMSRRLPLIILLHGYAGNAAIMNYYFGLRHEVDSRKFILVVPNGKTDSSGMRFWNATPACCDFDHSNSDDVGYILNLIKEMKRRYKVDESRVFVVGHSNGAFMAHRLACEPNSPVRGNCEFRRGRFFKCEGLSRNSSSFGFANSLSR